MRILLTKLSDERHALEIVRDDGRRERVELETRSALLHDLTHFAVEQAAALDQGFFGSVAAGKSLAEVDDRTAEGALQYTGEPLQIERIVAVLQKITRTGETPASAHGRITSMLALQDATPPAWFTLELVTEVHERMRRLVGQWKATPYRSSMELNWSGPAE